ncbi:MAG TPA: efflux transporter outer membrane subunit [Methylomirabilota bacterium]|nr:efflux transporter outer membrane subunit [Methylomirabilota bacterium]
MRRFALVATAVMLAGCTVGPDYRRPAVQTPSDFRGAMASATEPSLGDLPWWRVFPDKTLQQLIREALAQNYDVRIAAARILEARAQVTIARSFQFPTVNASASAPYSRTEGTLLPFQFRETLEPAGGLDFSFEVDLWGRFRRNSEAARAEMLGAEYVARFVVTTLVSDLGSAYIRLRALDEELQIARRTLDSRRGSLDLVNLRERGGVAGLIDVRQSEILVAGAAQTVPDIERQIEQTENVISILLGRPPAAVPRGRPLGAQIVATVVPAGLPARLLEQRPDVRQAETQLAAATARIGVAKADYFPRVFLMGAMSAGGLVVNGQTFGPQGLFSLLPSVTLPIFTAGRVSAGVAAARARTEAAGLQYQQTMLTALQDVSDALVEYSKRREARAQQEALTVAARETTQLANVRYTGGVTPYLEVLDSERQLFDAELGLVRLQRDELLAVVRLYKALGGGWQP